MAWIEDITQSKREPVPRACYSLYYSPLPVCIQTAVFVIFILFSPVYHSAAAGAICNTKSLEDNPFSPQGTAFLTAVSLVSHVSQEQILALSSLRNCQKPKKRVLPEETGPTLEERLCRMVRMSEKVMKTMCSSLCQKRSSPFC